MKKSFHQSKQNIPSQSSIVCHCCGILLGKIFYCSKIGLPKPHINTFKFSTITPHHFFPILGVQTLVQVNIYYQSNFCFKIVKYFFIQKLFYQAITTLTKLSALAQYFSNSIQTKFFLLKMSFKYLNLLKIYSLQSTSTELVIKPLLLLVINVLLTLLHQDLAKL